MQWEEVRKIYPDQYVKLQILASHTEGNTRSVDEVALIRAIQDPKEATKELLQSKDGVIVSHTANKELKVEIRKVGESLKDKSYVDLKDLVQLIEENFGFNVTLQRKDENPTFTDEQKKRMTLVIFKDKGVLSQLQQAQKDRRDGISTYSDSEEEFANLDFSPITNVLRRKKSH